MHATFVAFDAYPLLDPSSSAGIGGAEVRAITFARGLRDHHGVDVDVVVNARVGLKETAGGFRVLGYQKPSIGPLAKLGHSLAKRWTQRPPVNPFFSQLNADAVLCFGVRNDTASIVRSCIESGKKCVVFLTSDRNIEDAQRKGRRDRGAYGELGHLCRYTLQRADLVVAQTPFQLEALQKKLGVNALLIRNPIDLTRQATFPTSKAPTVLWIGRADTFSKRADLCVELANRCPNYQFRMIMNNHDHSVFEQIRQSAPDNVQIIEHVPFQEIETHFQQANLLVNTSVAEGFPNSFLQAAKYGKPIISLNVDSGKMLSEFRCGICAKGDLEHMANVIDSLIANRQFYDQTAKSAIAYVEQYHDATARCSELHAALSQLAHRLKTVA